MLNYLDEWLNGIKVSGFTQLRDLIIINQIKRKVPAEVREHFIDMEFHNHAAGADEAVRRL